jgi:hypothetical protein
LIKSTEKPRREVINALL